MYTVCSHFLKRDDDTEESTRLRKAYRSWFIETYPKSEFKSDELLLYFVIKYIDRLDLLLTPKAIEAFSAVELQKIIVVEKLKVTGTSKYRIDDVGQINQIIEVTKNYLNLMLEKLYSNISDLSNFILDADTFRKNKQEERIYDLFNEGSTIVALAKEKKSGSDDALNFLESGVTEISDIYSASKLEELITEIDYEKDGQFSFVSKFGIAPIDEITGGMFTTELISIEALPGIGKTKFVLIPITWIAAVVYKRNVLLYSLEQTNKELDAILVARHYFYLYQQQMDEMYIRIEDLYEVLDDETKQKIEMARYDLFKSGKYGKIVLVCDVLYSDTFIRKIKIMNKLHCKFDIVVIDYIGLIKPPKVYNPRNSKSFEIITDCLTDLKAYCRATNTTGVAVNQRNSKAVQNDETGKKSDPSAAQGGMTVYRSTDKNLIISATEAQVAQDLRDIELSKARGAKRLITCTCKTMLSMGLFYSTYEDIHR